MLKRLSDTTTAASTSTPVDILVAVLTTGQRADSLGLCLSHLLKLKVPQDISFHFLLVQNGIDRPTLDQTILAGDHVSSCQVIAEPQKGIPPARNAALEFAERHGFAWLAFMDDDAAPEPNWLERLTRPILARHATAASGPQIPVFSHSVSTRLAASKVYRERRLQDGSETSWAATNNVVFSVHLAALHDLRFNEEMTSGGSDKEFFLRFVSNGGRIQWVETAIVREKVEPERLTLKWIAKREWRKGATEFRMQRAIGSTPKAAALCTAKSGFYALSGLGNLVLTAVPGQAGYVDTLADFSHAFGLLAGLVPAFRPRAYT